MHTRGPWKVIRGSDCQEIQGPKGERIAMEPIEINEGSPETGIWLDRYGTEDNLNLISAAPELLFALEAVVSLSTGTNYADVMNTLALAREAIAKAKGHE